MEQAVEPSALHQRGEAERHDVIVVGAGFGGIYAVHRLRNQGLDVLCLEAAPDVGGVWYHNAYPGARCDLPSVDYSYSFSEELQQEWFWTERYSAQPEILRYLRHVTDRFDLRRSMRFNVRVSAMKWDEETKLWKVTTDVGQTYTAGFVVLATGPLAQPKKLDIPGISHYKGEFYETSRWPHHPVTFEGKRVAVIGTGPSGLQTITEVAKVAGRLTVFQRTPTFTAPARNGPTDPKEFSALQGRYSEYRGEMKQTFNGSSYFASGKAAVDCTPEERKAVLDAFWTFGGIGYVWAFNDVLFDEEANAIVADFLREKMAAQIKEPLLREKLLPRDYPVGTRRPCCDSGYLEAFNRENVTLVDLRETPMVRFTGSGIETSDGHHELDVIIVAIGFDALTGALTAINPVNGKGERLGDTWKDGVRTYLGLGVAGFPNMFFVNGPLGLSAAGNVPLVSENDGDFIGDCIAWMQKNGYSRVEPTRDAQDAWCEEVARVGNTSLFMKTPSWFTGGNIPGKKREMLMYLGGLPAFVDRCRQVAEGEYEGFVAS